MHLDKISEVTIPVIEGYHRKLTFEGDSPFAEAITIDEQDCYELQAVHNIRPIPDDLMAMAGVLEDEDGEEIEVYAVYAYDDKVYFLTIIENDAMHTYDFLTGQWVQWQS